MKENKVKAKVGSRKDIPFRQRKVGQVVSTQMNSTIVVAVDSFVTHPLYDKKIRQTRRFLVHAPENTAKLGDSVTIEESRPISKLKRWVLISVDKVADNAPTVAEIEKSSEINNQN